MLEDHPDFTGNDLERLQQFIFKQQMHSMLEFCARWGGLDVRTESRNVAKPHVSLLRVTGEPNVERVSTDVQRLSLPDTSMMTSVVSLVMPHVTRSNALPSVSDSVSPVTGEESCDESLTEADGDLLLMDSEPDDGLVCMTGGVKAVVGGGVHKSSTLTGVWRRLVGGIHDAVKRVSDDFNVSSMDGSDMSVLRLLWFMTVAFGMVLVLFVCCLSMACLFPIMAEVLTKVSAAARLATAKTVHFLPAVENVKPYPLLVLNRRLDASQNVMKRSFDNVTLSFASIKAGLGLVGRKSSYTILSWEKLTENRVHALEIKINSTEEKLASLQGEVADERLKQNAFFFNVSGHLDKFACNDRVDALESSLREVQTGNLTMVDGKVVHVLDVTQTPEFKSLLDKHTKSLEEIQTLRSRLEVLENKTCAAPEEVKALQDSLAAIQIQVNTLTHPEWDLQQIRLTAKYQVQVMVVYTVLGSATLILWTIQAANWAQSIDLPISVGGIMSMIWRFVTYNPVI
jgi:hypothetical protein